MTQVPAFRHLDPGRAARASGSRRSRAWLGTLPFLLFAGLFLLSPVVLLAAGSLHDAKGALTLQNYSDLARPDVVLTFRTTIEISLVTATVGADHRVPHRVRGLILAGLPSWLRAPIVTFARRRLQLAGVPLALALIFTLGHSA